jgi:RNA polymerase sigma factor (sigma-70 family)
MSGRGSEVAASGENNLTRLIATYRPQLKTFIRQRVKNREDAEDILQDVLFQWVKTVYSALDPIEHLAAWLFRVARNAIINHHGKKRELEMPVYQNEEEEWVKEFSEVLFHTDASDSPETAYLRTLVWEALEGALAELSPEQREAYELTELAGLPVKEIARLAGLPVNTLLSRKHYAVLHLRKRMRALYEEVLEG